MKMKRERPANIVGDVLIGFGSVLCLLSTLVFFLSAASGTPNGLMIFGGGTLGLLMVIVGYLQRITAILLSKVETPSVAASETRSG